MKNTVNIIKKNWITIGFILYLIILFSFVFFTDYLVNGDDTYFHLNRINGIGNAIRDGQFLPKIYPLTNFEFGYAIPLFYSDIFMYPAAILYILGFSLINSYKLTVLIYVVLGTVMTYLLASKLFKNNDKLIYIITFVYSFNPYRYIDVFFRSSFSEFIAITFFPLLLYAFYEIFINKRDRFILLGISMTCILLSHNLSFLLCILVYIITLIVFMIYTKDYVFAFKITIKAATIGFLLTAFFTLPLLEQLFSQEFKVSLYTDTYSIKENIINITDIFHIFNFIEKPDFEMIDIHRYGIGIVSLLLPIINFFTYRNKWIYFITILHYTFILMACGIIPIYNIDLFNMLQFSFRFYLLIYLTSIICVSSALYKCKKQIVLIVFTIMSINIGLFAYSYLRFNEDKLVNTLSYNEIFAYDEVQYFYDHRQTGVGEYLPIIESDDYIFDTNKIIEVVDGEKYYTNIEFDRYMTNINFTYNSSGNDILMMPLTYYKGYLIVASNSEETIKIEAENHDIYKKVTINTLQGEWNYNIKYSGTLLQHLSLFISFISLLSLIIWKIKAIKYKSKAS